MIVSTLSPARKAHGRRAGGSRRSKRWPWLAGFLLAVLAGFPRAAAAWAERDAVLPAFGFGLALPAVRGFGSPAGLARGKFLVASRQLGDPNFSETVVLLIDYDQRGAMGLVINRPSEVSLSAALPGMKGLKGRKDKVYMGGPVARVQMLVLVRSRRRPKGSRLVFDDVYVSGRPAVLRKIIAGGDPESRFRVYAGRAGWAPGQLDGEVSRGDWHVTRADPETIFDRKPSEIWPRLLHQSAGRWVRALGTDP